eukprot:105824-Chlamydomonas_euryale.AAC.2
MDCECIGDEQRSLGTLIHSELQHFLGRPCSFLTMLQSFPFRGIREAPARCGPCGGARCGVHFHTSPPSRPAFSIPTAMYSGRRTARRYFSCSLRTAGQHNAGLPSRSHEVRMACVGFAHGGNSAALSWIDSSLGPPAALLLPPLLPPVAPP